MLKEQEQAVIERILSRAGLLSEYYNKAVAKVLVEAGYRKADEVRKETAKEILDLLIRYDDGDSNNEAINLIIDHYGLREYIEVDE